MSLKVLIDMNLLRGAGLSAVHWSAVGDPRSTDRVILEWARQNGYVVLTQDLDFGTLLALTHAKGPSVLLVRGHNTLPDSLGDLVTAAFRRHEDELISGALVTVEEGKNRVRILPI